MPVGRGIGFPAIHPPLAAFELASLAVRQRAIVHAILNALLLVHVTLHISLHPLR